MSWYNVSMEEAAKKWLDYAQGDLEAAEVLLEHPKSHRSYQLVVMHCHQAVEKLLKAVIVKQEKEIKNIHDLTRLLEELDIDVPRELSEYVDELNPHYHTPRYPDLPSRGPSFSYNKEIALYHISRTKELFVWITDHQLT